MTLRIKRLVASISAGIEDVVGKLENHEAVADCLLDDLRQGIAQVKVQRGRIETQAKRTETQLKEAQRDVERWQLRAVKVADEDEAKALHCLQRAEHSENTAATLTEQLNAHLTTLQELDARIAEMEVNLNELMLKRASLSAREVNARAKRPTGDCSDSAVHLFERWVESVMTHESAAGVLRLGGHIASDVIEREFVEEEQQANLKAKLAELKDRVIKEANKEAIKEDTDEQNKGEQS